MPATRRLSRNTVGARRRSSLGLTPLSPAKAGVYSIGHPPNRLTFCPNVTPGTFTSPDSEDTLDATTSSPSSPTSTLFPPSETPAPPPTRRRVPPGKRRSLGYIPRPPNAFMLFRADFVRQKHVPGSIETNHGSLSKIIGNCWRSLPMDEKRIWEIRARQEKTEHKKKYPEYRFRPVHNKNKNKQAGKNAAPPAPPAEPKREAREAYIVNLLMTGHKGESLSEKIREWDELNGWEGENAVKTAEVKERQERERRGLKTEDGSVEPVSSMSASGPLYPHRRSSSVPLPNDFYSPYSYPTPGIGYGMGMNTSMDSLSTANAATLPGGIVLPSLTNFSSSTFPTNHHPNAPNFLSRPPSPSPTGVASISRQQRLFLGARRASSAQPAFDNRSWVAPQQGQYHLHLHLHDQQQHQQQLEYSPSASSSSLQRDDSPLPEADTSLFDPAFLNGGVFGSASSNNSISTAAQPQEQCSPFDQTPPPPPAQIHQFGGYSMDMESQTHYPMRYNPHLDPQIPLQAPIAPNVIGPLDTYEPTGMDMGSGSSHASSVYEGSPGPEVEEGMGYAYQHQQQEHQGVGIIHAPQPMHHPLASSGSGGLELDGMNGMSHGVAGHGVAGVGVGPMDMSINMGVGMSAAGMDMMNSMNMMGGMGGLDPSMGGMSGMAMGGMGGMRGSMGMRMSIDIPALNGIDMEAAAAAVAQYNASASASATLSTSSTSSSTSSHPSSSVPSSSASPAPTPADGSAPTVDAAPAPIDNEAAFTDLWKGLSASGSFAMAMDLRGFPEMHIAEGEREEGLPLTGEGEGKEVAVVV